MMLNGVFTGSWRIQPSPTGLEVDLPGRFVEMVSVSYHNDVPISVALGDGVENKLRVVEFDLRDASRAAIRTLPLTVTLDPCEERRTLH